MKWGVIMIDKWKLAIKEFLKEYEDDDMVVGALLCGSYATGNQNDNSDIDIQLILKDDATYQERGCLESNSYLIEYFMNPIHKVKSYFESNYEEGKNVMANMFAFGKIIYDVDGSVKMLQDLALEYVDKQINMITSDNLNMNNYHIWDNYSELKSSLEDNDLDFNSTYFELLKTIFESYYEFLQLPKIPSTKTYRILTDKKFRSRYHIYNIPEDKFVKLYLKCYEIDKPENMYRRITDLIDYYYDKIGGFNIRSFKRRKELEQ